MGCCIFCGAEETLTSSVLLLCCEVLAQGFFISVFFVDLFDSGNYFHAVGNFEFDTTSEHA
jgi:hypothetical protein